MKIELIDIENLPSKKLQSGTGNATRVTNTYGRTLELLAAKINELVVDRNAEQGEGEPGPKPRFFVHPRTGELIERSGNP